MKILIVDDNPDAAGVLVEAAKLFGWDDIATAESGEDAIGKAIVESYDVIALDIRMEGVSGLDALPVIRGLLPHTIIAIVSAYVHDIGPDDMSAADVVMPKPVSIKSFQKLLELTGEIAERREAIRKLGQN